MPDMPERTCAECATVIPWLPRRKYCESCAVEVKRRQAREAYYAAQAKKGVMRRGEIVTARCRYCEREFSHVLFSVVRVTCDDCVKRLSGQARAKWVKEHPERIAEIKKRHYDHGGNRDLNARFRRYGVSREWYLIQIRVQGNRCANQGCRTSTPGGRHDTWHIDHDHVTGQVRGLLCNNCNLAAGYARDDPEVLAGLSRYVATHRQLRLAI